MQYYPYLVTMNARIDQLVKSLLLKDSLEQCSLHEVEQFAERHPYFGAAQLLLTKKLQTENPARYTEQLQKTHLFFHNPLWVEQLLNDTGNAVIIKNDKVAEPAPEKEPGILSEVEISPVTETLAGPNLQDTVIVAEPSPAGLPDETLHPGDMEIAAETAKEEPFLDVVSIAEMENTATGETLPVSDTVAVSTEEKESITEANGDKKEAMPEMTVTTGEQQEFNPGMPDAVTGNELIFEPYHTVDYFASQGIKFREEEVPKDKFSQQLKSFTGWLRTLKKLPVAEISRAPVSHAEHKVEQLALHSLQEGDVVTETMAEVWEKQGNYARAIDIYSKLSLLEPAKSTYFAAKIEELKKLN